jgi:hypothetical protein
VRRIEHPLNRGLASALGFGALSSAWTFDMSRTQTIQEKADKFCMYLGMCITEWSRVEDQLFKLCRDILATTTEQTAIIYYRTPTLDSRLDLAHERMDTIFPVPESGKHRHDDYKIWKEFTTRLKSICHSAIGLHMSQCTPKYLPPKTLRQNLSSRQSSTPT